MTTTTTWANHPSGPSLTRYLGIASVLLFLQSPMAMAQAPSFNCAKIEVGSIEEMVCLDESLSALDVRLAKVYTEARSKAVNEHPPTLKAEQRGWIKGRNDCWKSEDKHHCVAFSYQSRIAELQARYRLVDMTGPVVYQCNGSPANELVVNYFKTEPASLIAEYGDSVSLMFIQPSGSGANYAGQNESLWEHQGEAKVVWGYEAAEMRCFVLKSE